MTCPTDTSSKRGGGTLRDSVMLLIRGLTNLPVSLDRCCFCHACHLTASSSELLELKASVALMFVKPACLSSGDILYDVADTPASETTALTTFDFACELI